MKIDEIELLSEDLDATIAFYRDVIGLPVIFADDKKISLRAGRSVLTFLKSTQRQPRYHFAFNIPSNQLDEAIAWISYRTKPITMADNSFVANFESWNAKAVYFYDNNANIAEFIVRYDLANAGADPFGPASIECISEVAIVTDSPVNLGEKLVQQHGLYYFAKGTKDENFAAMGTDDGLLILVKTNRNWFSTNDPAQKFATKVKLTTVEGTTVELLLNTEPS